MIQKRHPHFERVLHTHAICESQQIAGQVVIQIASKTPFNIESATSGPIARAIKLSGVVA